MAQLKLHKKRIEEAKRRDHRTVGKKLNLFSIQEVCIAIVYVTLLCIISLCLNMDDTAGMLSLTHYEYA